MMDIIKNVNEIFQTIYLLSAGPILTFLAFKGLEQLKIAKKALKINSQRDAFKIAGEQCQFFAEKIIPLYTKFQKEMEANNGHFLDKFEIKVEKNAIFVKNNKPIEKEDTEALRKSESFGDLLNAIEGFSMYFASGVAASNVGYLTCGRCYVEVIKKLCPILVKEAEGGYFKNTCLLFTIWYNKCSMEDITKMQQQLADELKNKKSLEIQTLGCN